MQTSDNENSINMKEITKQETKEVTMIDWEQRRYELVKAIVGGFAVNQNGGIIWKRDIPFAIETADRIIKALKETDDETKG